MLGSTPSNLGYGVRWWWLCPSCGRRAGVLYAPGFYWRCRHCWKISYTSSNQVDKRVSALLDSDVHSRLDDLLLTEAGLNIATRDLKLLFKACRIQEQRVQRKLRRHMKATQSRTRQQ